MYPSHGGQYIHLPTAHVSARYLEGLLCASRPLDSELSCITGAGQEFLDLLRAVPKDTAGDNGWEIGKS